MNSTKNVTIKKNKPNSEVLFSIRSFARAYQNSTSKKYVKSIAWVEN
ncbi:MAG: hypothetical protein VXY79_05775 [Bacteroidota bacterium]|nr:hypothetical protein [Bacteroidota bacterium]MEC7526784.1 hypothetical protein [Bacteroidota bacterium]MEC7813259.1 hypothetical protein [Bacteroidota bacterium]MEC7944648.1 hypothetical protein [Bacteroidota bacterium]MEC8286923.1 hypothetical protein [Bacteroidota bacterium]|tara:strand:- start:708 stop:848 length:141 start_codon:yes stop_codon:yes gene_type:complete